MLLDKLKLSSSLPIDIPLPQTFKAEFDNGKVNIKTPLKLCIYEEDSFITYQFVNYIEELIFKYKIGIVIDFSQLEYISAAASLLLFAKISKCQLCINAPNDIDIVQPVKKEIRAIFQSSGLWSGIKPGGVSKIRKLLDTNNQYLSGSNEAIENFDKVLASTIVNLAKQNVKFTRDNGVIFTRGITEAILNVQYHAYSDKSLASMFPQISNGRWWQCCWLDHENQRFVFIIFDDGEGIPDGIRRAYNDKGNDSELIKRAMTKGVSKTLNPQRGKGSDDIIKTSCVFPNSHLLIISGNGHYKHDESGVSIKELPFKLDGTLTQWVLDYKADQI